MAAYFPVPIPRIQAPSIQLPLDGELHRITVTWNVSAQRFYFNLYNSSSVWIVTKPLIATGPGREILGVAYEEKLRSVRVTLKHPFWRPLGQIVYYTLEGVDPSWLNGKHRCEVIAPDEFLFHHVSDDPSKTIDPGHIPYNGTASRYVNLVEGYMTTSVLIFRNRQFEVS